MLSANLATIPRSDQEASAWNSFCNMRESSRRDIMQTSVGLNRKFANRNSCIEFLTRENQPEIGIGRDQTYSTPEPTPSAQHT